MQISYDKNSIIIDDKREFIKSAALHYFRLPGKDLWFDRLSKIKAAGYNTVDLYFCWNYHSSKQGEYDFSGVKDVKELLKLTQELGLFVIARPGPFINAEVTAGGLPFWLLNNPNVVPRNRQDGDFIYSQPFMDAVKEWYNQIIPIINGYDNVIAFQIENEYSTNEEETQYMTELYDWARSLGVKAPIFHNDAYCAGLYADLVDIYACDIYPYINPETDWKQNPYCFDNVDNLESNIRSFKEESPIFVAEMQAGWFDKYNGQGYEHIRKSLGDEHINIMTKTSISQGLTMFNHYMGCGGTNWNEIGCDETYTSYDFAAPISEEGLLMPNYFKAKEINYFLKAFDFTQTTMKEEENDILTGEQENIYAKIRYNSATQSQWLFIRNLNNDTKTINFKKYPSLALKPFEMKLLPINLPLKACKMEFSEIEIFTKIEDKDKEVVFMIADNGFIEISDFEKYENIDSLDIETIENKIKIKINKNTNLSEIKFVKGEKTTNIVFLDKNTSDKTWLIENKIIVGADIITNNNQVGFKKPTTILEYDLTQNDSFVKKEISFENKPVDVIISDVQIQNAAPEIDRDYDYTKWQDVFDKYDCASNNIFDEFIFYKGKISKDTQEITISAQHILWVYINGEEAFCRDSYYYENLSETSETITFKPDESLMTEDMNEITILVQQLGFNKGFSNDINLPRGILEFKTVPEQDIKLKIKGKLAAEETECKISQNDCIQKISTSFEVKKEQYDYAPLFLSVEDLGPENITIFLNGYKIGHYIKDRTPQARFYLIDSFLKENNVLDIIVCNRKCKNMSSGYFNSCLKNVNINIRVFEQFKLFNSL